MSNDREEILARVKAALAPLEKRAALPDWENELVILRQAQAVVDPWALFSERIRAVNGTALTDTAALVEHLNAGGWKRGYCDPVLWSKLQAIFPPDIAVETVFDRSRVDDYEFGITRAAGAVAETGTVILNDSVTSDRLAALAPWVHVAVLESTDIFTDLTQAVSALGEDPNVIWCTGPSKTADVEGILIEGVHGPGVQIVLRLG